MEKDRFEKELAQVAEAYQVTPGVMLQKMEHILREGQQSRDPQVQSLWAAIPRSGSTLTPEDLVSYLAETLPRPFLP